ncbi:MAG: hypothetical protein JEZ09_10430 [Salinivirgaceae bacterium]|nr:hypothetical protein [Salinivirgaceae bacterium]
MIRLLSIITLTLLLQLNVFAKASIQGYITLNDSWAPTIYLSLINSFDDLNTASYDFLIFEEAIDETGFFRMDSLDLPHNDRIYRLHICKKGDPVSTIIIGGKDENFIHFIMNKHSKIEIIPEGSTCLFKNYRAEGHPANTNLKMLFALQNELLSPPKLPSLQNRNFLQEKVLEDLKHLADTSSFSLIKLLSLYYIGDFYSLSNNIYFIETTVNTIQKKDSSSPYYKAFIDELEYYKYQTKASKTKAPHLYFIALFAIILLALFIYIKLVKKPMFHHKNNHSELISLLSIQERKVLNLLIEGKSNKEISSDLHIEVSTVKSHLNKIYSRLGVKSRKEIVNNISTNN